MPIAMFCPTRLRCAILTNHDLLQLQCCLIYWILLKRKAVTEVHAIICPVCTFVVAGILFVVVCLPCQNFDAVVHPTSFEKTTRAVLRLLICPANQHVSLCTFGSSIVGLASSEILISGVLLFSLIWAYSHAFTGRPCFLIKGWGVPLV